jgi:hypothetical protein
MSKLLQVQYLSRYALLEELNKLLIYGLEFDTVQYVEVLECDKSRVREILSELDRRLINVAFTKAEKDMMSLDDYIQALSEGAYEYLPATR